MTDLSLYHLSFSGGLHLGARGVDLEDTLCHIPSDTLFSAVVAVWARLGMDVPAALQPFAVCAPDAAASLTSVYPPDPPFLITSAFPFAGGVRFFPMPVNLAALFSPKTIREYGKTLRRIRYLSEGLLRRALQGAALDAALFPTEPEEEPKEGAALQGGAFWLSAAEIENLPDGAPTQSGRRHALYRYPLWAKQVVQRVTVDRTGSAPNLFQAGQTVYNQDCGLWFGAQWRRPQEHPAGGAASWQQLFNRALEQLQYDGLGGERTAGYGGFTLLDGETQLSIGDALQADKPGYLLSRYLPHSSELPQALSPALGAAYSLSPLQGWLQTGDGPAQRRKRTLLVNEGSLICPPAFPAGQVADLRPAYAHVSGIPSHPVYRSGLALALAWGAPTVR